MKESALIDQHEMQHELSYPERGSRHYYEDCDARYGRGPCTCRVRRATSGWPIGKDESVLDPSAPELSYPERKTLERGRSFWAQVWDHLLISIVIVTLIASVAWAVGKW